MKANVRAPKFLVRRKQVVTKTKLRHNQEKKFINDGKGFGNNRKSRAQTEGKKVESKPNQNTSRVASIFVIP